MVLLKRLAVDLVLDERLVARVDVVLAEKLAVLLVAVVLIEPEELDRVGPLAREDMVGFFEEEPHQRDRLRRSRGGTFGLVIDSPVGHGVQGVGGKGLSLRKASRNAGWVFPSMTSPPSLILEEVGG